MAQTAKNVVGSQPKAGGAVWVAPVDSTVPTDASSALDVAFKSLGYIATSGIVEAINKETSEIPAYGGDVVLILNTKHSVTYKFKPMEHTADVLKLIYGDDNVIGSGDEITSKLNGKELDNKCFVFETVLSDGRVERIVVPNAKVTAIGESNYADGSEVSNEITITCFPDASGNKAYKYIAKVG